jgi:predicted RNA binding protein YcfA (HicA-like mRNA interferase family)
MPVRLTAKEIISVLTRHGFVCVSQKGSHQKWKNRITGAVTIVPFHSGKQIPAGTMNSIIKASGIDKREFGIN